MAPPPSRAAARSPTRVGGGADGAGGSGVIPVAMGVAPFGYGVVQQALTDASGLTGSAWCAQAFGSGWRCLSVSGATSCEFPVPAEQLVSCSQAASNTVDETPFMPSGSCADPLLTPGEQGFCAGSDYMQTRDWGTLYLYDDYVRFGVSTNAGGTIYEIYGTDKIDRILQNGGGALQLSVYAYSGIGRPASELAWFGISSSDTACDPTPYPDQATCKTATNGNCQYGVNGVNVTDCKTVFACADNGQSPGANINPYQAAAPGCGATSPADHVDQVTSLAAGQVQVTKVNPWQGSKSDGVAGLTWSEAVSVFGPYAAATYHVTYSGPLDAPIEFQEMPAIFGREHVAGGKIYFYDGKSPWTDDPSVADVTVPDAGPPAGAWIVRLPDRTGPYPDGAPDYTLSEDWLSDCATDGTHCLTVATFSQTQKNMIVIGSPTLDVSYQGLHGYYPLNSALDETFTTYFFPYRYDQVVQGLTIRQWIANLKAGKPNPPAGTPASAAPPPPTHPYPNERQFVGGMLLLRSDDSVVHVNGLTLTFQPDGDLVAFDANHVPVWSSKSSAPCGNAACTANFQGDGNLVLYNGAQAFWSSQSGTSTPATLTVSNQAPYLSVSNAQGVVVWSSK